MKQVPNTKYSLEYICKNWFDNANVNINFSNDSFTLLLDFYIFGEVEGKFFKVTIEVKKWLYLSISKDNEDDEQFRMVLDASITRKSFDELIKEKLAGIIDIPQKDKKGYWNFRANSGELELQVITDFIDYSIWELNEKEYKSNFI